MNSPTNSPIMTSPVALGPPGDPSGPLSLAWAAEQRAKDSIARGIADRLNDAKAVADRCEAAIRKAIESNLARAKYLYERFGDRAEGEIMALIGRAYEQSAPAGCPPPSMEEVMRYVRPSRSAFSDLPSPVWRPTEWPAPPALPTSSGAPPAAPSNVLPCQPWETDEQCRARKRNSPVAPSGQPVPFGTAPASLASGGPPGGLGGGPDRVHWGVGDEGLTGLGSRNTDQCFWMGDHALKKKLEDYILLRKQAERYGSFVPEVPDELKPIWDSVPICMPELDVGGGGGGGGGDWGDGGKMPVDDLGGGAGGGDIKPVGDQVVKVDRGPDGTCCPITVIVNCPPGQVPQAVVTEAIISDVQQNVGVGDAIAAVVDDKAPIISKKPWKPPTHGRPFWGDEGICVSLDANAEAIAGPIRAEINDIFRPEVLNNDLSPEEAAKAITKEDPSWAKVVTEPMWTAITRFFRLITSDASTGEGCNPVVGAAPAIMRGLLDLIQRWIPIGLGDLKQTYDYTSNYYCPTLIPSQDEVDRLYLSNQIGKTLWRCYTRANNNWDGPREKVVNGARTRPGVGEATILFLRGLITEGEWAERLRGLGVLNTDDRDQFLRLGSYWPGVQDIIRFMVRDVWDEPLVREYNHDFQFDEKYTAEAERLGKGAGLSRDTARLFWRAHWDLPSNTQAYEMLHRLRPGAVFKDIQTTEADVAKLLEANDMSPFWAKRLIAVSYAQMRLVDIKRAYFVGILSPKAAQGKLMDRGYTAADAAKVEGIWKGDKLEYWKSSPLGKAYISGAMNERELKFELDRRNVLWDEQTDIVRMLTLWANWQGREKCVKAIRARYLKGEFDRAGATAALMSYSVDLNQTIGLLNAWDCELRSRPKEVSALKLCEMATAGLLTVNEFRLRLRRIGYLPADADRMVSLCQLKRNQKVAAAQAKQRAQQLAAQKAAAKAAALAAKQGAAAAKAAQAAMARAADRAEKQRLAQVALIEKAATLSGRSIKAETAEVGLRIADLRTRFKLSRSAANAFLRVVLAESKAAKEDDWRPRFTKALTALVGSSVV